MTTVVCGPAETVCHSGHADETGLWLSPDELAAATGWQLKPEGFCKDDVCVPLSPGQMPNLVRGDKVNADGFWRRLGHPVTHDAAAEIWVFGTGAAQRSSALTSLQAPDFALPDLEGNVVELAHHRGKKVLLATWASW